MSFVADMQCNGNDSGLFDAETLAAYRAWAFPPALANEFHTPCFAVHAHDEWMTLDGISLFLAAPPQTAPAVFLAPCALNPHDVAAFAQAMLPPHLRTHVFFTTSAWISAAAFAAFLAQPRSDVVSVNGSARRIKGPRRAGALVSRFVIELDEDDSDESDLFEENDALEASLKRKRTLHMRV